MKIDLRQEFWQSVQDLAWPEGTKLIKEKIGSTKSGSIAQKVWYETVNAFEKGTLGLSLFGVGGAEYFAHDHVSAAIWPMTMYLIHETMQRWTREKFDGTKD